MSVIPIYSLADLGYRRCGAIPKSTQTYSGERFAEAISKSCNYRTISNSWIRRFGRRRGEILPPMLAVDRILSADSSPSAFRLEFLRAYFSSIAGVPCVQPRTDFDGLMQLVNSADEKPRLELSAQAIGKAIVLAGQEHLESLLEQFVFPWFLKRFPQGRIVVIRHNLDYETATAGIRGFYTFAQMGERELKENTRVHDERFPTMRHWHASAPTLIASSLLDFWLNLFLPSVMGFRAGLFGLSILFLFGDGVNYVPPTYPTDWLHLLRSQASYGEAPASDADFIAALTNPKGDEAMRFAYRTPAHKVTFSIDDLVAFLDWYLAALNAYFFEATDVANFTEGNDPQDAIDPISAFEHYLTVDRLIRRTIAAMSAGDAGSCRGATFEAADLLDTLSLRFGATTSGADMFKTLFDPDKGPALLTKRLEVIPAVGDYLRDFTKWCYDELRDTIVKSVWLKSKLVGNDVMVRDRQLARENPEPIPKFVANVMRALRNGHHGYFSSEDEPRPSRYLFLVDGTVPDSMMSLPTLWLLAYLVDPGIVGWHRLDVSAYD